jgi:hypothetical protein
MRIDVSDREFHTILAALRCYQAHLGSPATAIYFDDDIASNLGEVEPLTEAEIDALCLRLNCGKGD